MRGRKPVPTHLKIVRGNPGKRALNREEPKPEGDLFQPPGDLPPGAVPFWNQAIADAPAGLLKRLDLRAVFAWAVAAWFHSEAAANVAKTSILVQSREGAIYQNPALAVVNKQAQIMLKAAAEMGFTPSSRSRISLGGGEGEGNPFDEF